jgi:hypothetical protein
MDKSELILMANELARCLKKYQARYHAAPHAQKDWDDSNEILLKWKEFNAKQHTV